ncbi:50S ribosomal protein L10 [Desulfobacterales bacterium HSG16]|nr:50S ribosomal protein L10 [Desulfobacterales bacterium HSG16]
MKIERKKEIVKQMHECFEKSKVVITVDYKGLNVAAISALRRKLKESEIEFKVVKNSLLILASEETDTALIKDSFKGPSAVALSYSDPVASAKVLTEFAKENEKLEIKVGVMDGKVLDLDAIKTLSSLPSKDELLGQLLSVINGVPTSFVRAVADVPRRIVNVLQAIKDQKEQVDEAA